MGYYFRGELHFPHIWIHFFLEDVCYDGGHSGRPGRLPHRKCDGPMLIERRRREKIYSEMNRQWASNEEKDDHCHMVAILHVDWQK